MSKTKTKKKRPSPKKPRKFGLYYGSRRKFQGSPFNRQLQSAVFRLYKYFEQERDHGGPFVDLKKVRLRVSQSLGISKTTVSKYVSIGFEGEEFNTPGKIRKHKRPKRCIDSFTKCALRNVIYEFHRNRWHITTAKLLAKLRQRDIDFKGGAETLRKVLHDIGFSYEAHNPTRKIQEEMRIQILRRNYLRRYYFFERAEVEGRKVWNFVYLDETWVFRRGTGKMGKSWQDLDLRSCPSKNMSTGARYIVIHAGGREGFVEGAGKVWCSSTKPKSYDDYHGDMNSIMFTKWLVEQLINNLEEPTVIVMDNAAYHRTQAKFSFI
ncbi:Protein-glutamine gamma-glutamyltransferase 2 [Frankliniella fusca]|uniref:Protein-glutamine gamma-glutamyltransferase 2 n=1 Tax=Frankliniella fusca TaxID=407009 RepID=A0AAE1LST5_9NEOP|nr:Protein-glutamine gamma-glutamyltransferase 2 [Frankliniella fusca]